MAHDGAAEVAEVGHGVDLFADAMAELYRGLAGRDRRLRGRRSAEPVRALMVTKFVPLPDDSGGKQRSLAIARRLAERTELVLCAYDDGSADLGGLEKLGVDVRAVPWRPGLAAAGRGLVRTRSISAGRFWSAALAAEVRRAAAEGPLDLLQVEYMQMAPFADGVAATTPRARPPQRRIGPGRRATPGPAGLPASAPFHLEAAALRALERRAMRRSTPWWW